MACSKKTPISFPCQQLGDATSPGGAPRAELHRAVHCLRQRAPGSQGQPRLSDCWTQPRTCPLPPGGSSSSKSPRFPCTGQVEEAPFAEAELLQLPGAARQRTGLSNRKFGHLTPSIFHQELEGQFLHTDQEKVDFSQISCPIWSPEHPTKPAPTGLQGWRAHTSA